MRKDRDQQGPQRETTPDRLRDTTPLPQQISAADFSYLEIIMSLQHSMGQLTEAVNGLKTTQQEQGKKIENLSRIVIAAGAILLAIGAVLTYFNKSINDAVVDRLLTPVVVQSSPTPTPSPTPPRSR